MAAGKHPPLRALLLSLFALAVPAAGAFWVPESWADYEALLWLLAVVPAFLLAYHRGWRGVASALATTMAVLSITYAATQATGSPTPALLWAVVGIIVLLSLAIGIFADRVHRAAGTDLSAASAFIDPATGLPNRAHAELHLEIEVGAAQRGRPLAVVLLDLDSFSGFNARHGSIAGDEILRALGDVLKRTTRRMNLTARFGDDEFICVLGGCDDAGAISFVHRFHNALTFLAGERPVPSISIGIASHTPVMKSHQDLLEAAENALRQAKKDGRGRVRVHGRPISLPLVLDTDATETPLAEWPKAVMPEGRGRGRKALIVADQAPVRALLARYLADHGFTVAQVSNVVDGVQCLTIEYDLFFTDISLTEGIGVELVRAAKLRWPSIQVIGLVQKDDGELIIDALNAGVDRYLVTPLDLPKVRHHITELLARRDRLVTSVLDSRQLTMEFQARTNEAMQQLRHTEEEFRTVVGSVHEVIFRTDRDGRFTALNDAWMEATGYTVEESLHRPLSDFVHESDRAEFAASMRALAEGERAEARGELRVTSSSHDTRWFELRAGRLFDAASRVIGITGTLEDVTARKRAEAALRRSEAESRGLLAALPDEVIRLSPDGIVLDYDGQDARADKGRHVGATLEQLFPAHALPVLRAGMQQALQSGSVQVREFSVSSGEDLAEYEVRLAPSGDEGVVALVRNVTERKSLEEKLRQSQKLEAIGRLAGGLAHDFNNLLTVVQGNAHLLSEEDGSDQAAAEYVEQIKIASERGAALVRQLLAFGRRQVMQPTTMSLNTVVEDTRSMLARLIGENILLEVDLAQDVGMVKADVGQIEQILVNLAVNARDALPGGGVLRITTRNGALALHNAQPRDADEVVLLTITDNGPGMDAETRERVFEPFFTTKGMAQASGLGLATVYGIVQQSGGTINVLSEPGRGTSFEIALPRVAS